MMMSIVQKCIDVVDGADTTIELAYYMSPTNYLIEIHVYASVSAESLGDVVALANYVSPHGEGYVVVVTIRFP